MQRVAGQLRFSPSDLGDFVACEHLTQLELAMAMSGGARPAGENAFAELLQRKGEAHELAYLQSLRDRGHAVVEVRLGEAPDWEAPARAPENPMPAAPLHIYQPLPFTAPP